MGVLESAFQINQLKMKLFFALMAVAASSPTPQPKSGQSGDAVSVEESYNQWETCYGDCDERCDKAQADVAAITNETFCDLACHEIDGANCLEPGATPLFCEQPQPWANICSDTQAGLDRLLCEFAKENPGTIPECNEESLSESGFMTRALSFGLIVFCTILKL